MNTKPNVLKAHNRFEVDAVYKNWNEKYQYESFLLYKNAHYLPEIASSSVFFNDLNSMHTFESRHEVIFPDKPVRLFLDLESKNSIDIEKDTNDMESIIKCIHGQIKEIYGIEQTEVIKLSACGDMLFSFHVVFPDIWFENTHALTCFMKKMQKEIQKTTPTELIDMSIYNESAIKQLRLPLFCKNGGIRPLLDVSNRIREPIVEKNIYQRACVSSCAGFNLLPDKEEIRLLGFGEKRKNKKQRIDNKMKSVPNSCATILKMLDVIHGPLTPRYFQAKDNVCSFTVHPSIFCPFHAKTDGSGYHSSNGSIVSIYNGEDISIFCLDNSCKRRYELPVACTFATLVDRVRETSLPREDQHNKDGT